VKLHHLAVCVTDLERGLALYRDVLGLAVIKRWDDAEGKPRSYWLELTDGAFLAVEHASHPEPCRSDEAPGWHCLALGIPRQEREAWRGKLERAGFAVFRETAYTMYIRDSDGNIVGLSHYPERELAGQ